MSILRRQVHLDFHTSGSIENIGTNFNKAEFQDSLKKGHINSITLFAKCHHGWAYNESDANTRHPHLGFDLLKAQIDAAHEIGVKTPVYLSAGIDEKLAREHPEWLSRRKDESFGEWTPNFSVPGFHNFCLNTPYLDILLNQIKEVCENYDDDGIFLDIVNVNPCYCQYCVRTALSMGLDPYNEQDAITVGEKVYANYTKRVRETIDSVKPGDRVFHNGGHIRRGRRDLAYMNTHLELESLPTGGWGYDHFPLSAAYSRTLGMDFIGMTGKFHTAWGEFGGFKHPNALRYEVSLSAALGAGCSIGDQCHPLGKLDDATYTLIGQAYKELEEKEKWLDGGENIADIAFLSAEAVENYYINKGLLEQNCTSKWNVYDVGVNRILLEGKYLYDVIDCESDFLKYKVIILPDVVFVTDEIKKKFDEFLAQGGKILSPGTSGLDKDKNGFVFDFGAKYIGENKFNPDYLRPGFEMEGLYNSAYVIYSKGYNIELNGGKELASRENPYFNRSVFKFCSHKHTPNDFKYAGPSVVIGNDGAYISWNIFEEYATVGSLIAKRTVTYVLDKLIDKRKTLETNLISQGVATLQVQDKEKRFIAHLLYAPIQKRGNNVEVIEELIPVIDTEVLLKTDKKIRKVYLAPQMEEIDFTECNGAVKAKVGKFECHQMVVFEY